MSDIALPPRRSGPLDRAPALVMAVALHLGLLSFAMFTPQHPLPPIGSSVPINIVSTAPATDSRPAAQAPVTQAAAAPEPTPQAPPQPPAPPVAPPAFTPTPPAPPKAQHPTPQPRPAPSASAPAAKPLDFNHLQQLIDSAQKTAGKPTSSAQRGPARAETAPQARPDAGQGVSESDQIGLSQLLAHVWVLPCGEPAVASVAPFKVSFTVTLTGHLLGHPTAHGAEDAPVVAGIVARRALDAVQAAVPYAAPYYGQPITVTFKPKEAYATKCSD